MRCRRVGWLLKQNRQVTLNHQQSPACIQGMQIVHSKDGVLHVLLVQWSNADMSRGRAVSLPRGAAIVRTATCAAPMRSIRSAFAGPGFVRNVESGRSALPPSKPQSVLVQPESAMSVLVARPGSHGSRA